MSHSGDAAEQIVLMSLEGVEVAAKITGSAAKEIAVLLIAALKSDNKQLKTKGRARLAAMLGSGKPLEIFSVKESNLKVFTRQAKDYGIVYCALRNTKNSPDGMVDILVKAEDAPKINRIVERFKFATVDKAKIEREIVATENERIINAEPEAPDLMDTEQLLDDFLGNLEDEVTPAEVEQSHPLSHGGKSPPSEKAPSELTSESKSKSEKASGDVPWLQSNKSSVKEELREIKAARKAQETERQLDRADPEKPKTQQQTTHKKQSSKKKSKKTKERS
ncbi:PcfB family protein [Clostridiaceae bacterium OttesenSCG-928-D20]|nr:PcfB family protein [Clostridiaceae bacterium OttesenSCG-928-D20]